jgi:hypothetical protein
VALARRVPSILLDLLNLERNTRKVRLGNPNGPISIVALWVGRKELFFLWLM